MLDKHNIHKYDALDMYLPSIGQKCSLSQSRKSNKKLVAAIDVWEKGFLPSYSLTIIRSQERMYVCTYV